MKTAITEEDVRLASTTTTVVIINVDVYDGIITKNVAWPRNIQYTVSHELTVTRRLSLLSKDVTMARRLTVVHNHDHTGAVSVAQCRQYTMTVL